MRDSQPTANGPTIAVGIPTYRRDEVLQRTIDGVLNLVPPADEILVVDQSPEHSPGVQAFLQAAHEAGQIRWIQQSPPNANAARNRIFAETACEIVLMLDDDVEFPQADLIAAHRAEFQADAELAAVSGMVLNVGQSPLPFDPAEAVRIGFKTPANADIHVRGVAKIHGNHHSVRREVALAVGGFDESFGPFSYGDDFDFAMRLGGERILTTSRARLVHLHAKAGGNRTTDGRRGVPDWARSVSPLAVVCRYGKQSRDVRRYWLKFALRAGPLRREVVLRPWRWPMAAIHFFVAWVKATRLARAGVRSRFRPDGRGGGSG